MKKIISIFSVMLLLLSGMTVYAQEISQDNDGDSGVTQVEQLLEVDVVNGTERIIDLPETATYSMVADTAASETILERSVIGTDERTKVTNTTTSPSYIVKP